MSCDELRLVFDGDPIPKGRPRNYGGRSVTPKRTRDAEQSIRDAVAPLDLVPFDEPIRLSADFYCRTARRTDIDNLLKLVIDALNGIAYTDDHLIHSLRGRLRRKAIGETPRTEVRIAPIRPREQASA